MSTKEKVSVATRIWLRGSTQPGVMCDIGGKEQYLGTPYTATNMQYLPSDTCRVSGCKYPGPWVAVKGEDGEIVPCSFRG